jgi:hypothetical protein
MEWDPAAEAAGAAVEAEVRAAEAGVKWAGNLPPGRAETVYAQTAVQRHHTLQDSRAHSRCARSADRE